MGTRNPSPNSSCRALFYSGKKTPPGQGLRSKSSEPLRSGLVEARSVRGAKKNAPQVTGRRSNYAHLTDINLQLHHHSFVKNEKVDDDH